MKNRATLTTTPTPNIPRTTQPNSAASTPSTSKRQQLTKHLERRRIQLEDGNVISLVGSSSCRSLLQQQRQQLSTESLFGPRHQRQQRQEQLRSWSQSARNLNTTAISSCSSSSSTSSSGAQQQDDEEKDKDDYYFWGKLMGTTTSAQC